MIKGVLAKDHRPYVDIVIGWEQGVQRLAVLVDTGFNGELKVPRETVRDLGLEITHVIAVLRADGTRVKLPAGLAYVSLENITKEINVIIAGSIPTIGTKLLNNFGYKLTIGFTSREVLLQKT